MNCSQCQIINNLELRQGLPVFSLVINFWNLNGVVAGKQEMTHK